MHLKTTTNKPTNPKTEQTPHKQPPQQHPPQTENIKQEYTQPARPQQYNIHYQQHQGVTSSSQGYPLSSHHAKQTSSTYPTKTHPESDPKKAFQMPSGQHQQAYGYSVQQQPSSYPDHQQYLNKTPSQAPAQV